MKIAFKGSLPTYKSSGPLGPAQVLDYLNQWGGGKWAFKQIKCKKIKCNENGIKLHKHILPYNPHANGWYYLGFRYPAVGLPNLEKYINWVFETEGMSVKADSHELGFTYAASADECMQK